MSEPLILNHQPNCEAYCRGGESCDCGAIDLNEGPTGCLDDGDELSRALHQLSHDELNRILREELNGPE